MGGREWGFKWADFVERQETDKKKRTEGLCVCAGLFLWGSVCVFQLWTVDYAKIHEDVCLSVSLDQLFSAEEDCKLFCKGENTSVPMCDSTPASARWHPTGADIPAEVV